MPISRLTTHPQAEMPEMPDTPEFCGSPRDAGGGVGRVGT